MKKYDNIEKTSLKPVVLLALSMLFAVTILLIFQGNFAQDSVGPISTSKKQDQNKTKFVKRRQFVEQKITNLPAKKPSAETLNKKVSGSSTDNKAKPTDKEQSVELNKKLKSAQDLVDTGDMSNIMEAKEILEKILAKDPRHDASLKEIAMIHLYDLDEPVKAQEYLERSYDLNPEDPLVFSETLQLAKENKNLAQFSEKVREKVEKNPDNLKIANQLAWSYTAGGDYQRSADTFAQNAYKHNSYKDAYYAAGQYKKIDDKAQAEKMLDLASQLLSESSLSDQEKRIQLEALKIQKEKLY